MATERGYQVSEAAQNLVIDRSMLGRRCQELSTEVAGERLSGPEWKELKQLRMEREILKKAAAFFAKESS
ncbi:hypothetical protein NONS58_27720 [Nitrosococcus oceani]|nr:hypothetical protein NONS58_27720 [Nitrosococcus oceani]